VTNRPGSDIFTGMIPALQQLRTYLDAAFPGLFNASLAGLLFVVLWGVRRWKPLFFAELPPAFQAWPALASGAIISALSASTSGTFVTAFVNALGMAGTGLVSGMLASGVHRTLKESVLPYGENQIPPKKDPAPMVTHISGLMVFVLALAIPGCKSFLHFSDPTAQAVTCAILEPEEALIESAAGVCGPFAPACLSALQALFGDACTAAATAGKSQDEAHAAGLAAVHKHAGAMRVSLVKAGVEVKP
jgi:hypothetical protein